MKKEIWVYCLAMAVLSNCKKENAPIAAPPAGCEKTIVEITASQLTVNTTWDSCHYYYVKTNLNVGALLTIEPGTIIKFNSPGGLQVNSGGRINATGNASHPVVFTSDKDDAVGNDITGNGNASLPKGADWNRINTNGQPGSSFVYCRFLYGGSSTGGGVLSIAGNSLNTTVDHCTFKYDSSSPNLISARPALDASGGGSGTIITNNIFERNTFPLGVSTSFSLDNSNSFQYSKFSCIAVSNAFAPQHSITWLVNTLPLAVANQLAFISDTLTIGPGVVLKFMDPLFQLTLQKEANLVGKDAAGVRFTSIKDDFNAIDSNGDGTATAPGRDWQGVKWNEKNDWFHWSNIYFAAH